MASTPTSTVCRVQTCDKTSNMDGQNFSLGGIVIKTEIFSPDEIDFINADNIKKENFDEFIEKNSNENYVENQNENIDGNMDGSPSSSDSSSEETGSETSFKKISSNPHISPYETYKQYCRKCDTYFIRQKSSILKRCGQCLSTLMFECMVCERKYKRLSNVYSHIKTKYDCRKRPDLYCGYCDYTNIHKGYMKNHILKKHGGGADDLATCSKCGRHFKRRYNAEEHELSCGGAPYIECMFCDFQTTYKVSFKVHMANHIIDLEDGASLVNEKFEEVTVDPLVDSEHSWRKGNPKIVDSKKKTVKNVKQLPKKPVIIDLLCRNIIRMYCFKCKKSRAIRGRKVPRCQDCGTGQLHECGLCKSKFNTYENVLRHLVDRHQNFNVQDIYLCATCDRRYDSFKKLARHENFCQRSYKCNLCPFAARTSGQLKRHKEKWHFGPLRTQHQPCQSCGRQMRSVQRIQTTNYCSACLYGQRNGSQDRTKILPYEEDLESGDSS